MKAIIISLNSVIDSHYYFDEFNLNKENFCFKQNIVAGGKGVNIAKVFSVFDADYQLFCLLGKQNSMSFEKSLSQFCVKLNAVYNDSQIRENISIHANNISETRLCTDNYSASDEECERVFEKAFKSYKENDVIVFSGRLPKGVSKKKIVDFLATFTQKGACLILDSVSFDLDDLSVIKPFLVKPNEQEILFYGESIETSVQNLINTGIEFVALSKGVDGILLYSKNNSFKCTPPTINAVSTVGAGDSAVAGFSYGIISKWDITECLKFAVTCGTSCCLTEGGNPPKKNDIMNIYSSVCLEEI